MTVVPFVAADLEALDEVAPASEPDLAGYLAQVEAFLRRYVAFPSEHEPIAVALWIAHAWIVETFETSPILAVTSAEMRSGKTRVLDCVELLVPNPFRVVTPSEAVTYTVLAQRPRPTFMLDEADAIFGARTAERYEGLRAILNAGNRAGTPVLRVKLDGRKREVESFDIFGPKAVAGIGELPATVADRSIPIRMRRRAPGEPIARFRQRIARVEAETIIVPDFEADPTADVPDELNDRAADSWEPLLAVADAAGGRWPTLARMAAVAIGSEEETPVSVGMRLLADINEVFGGDEHLQTGELLRRLHDLEEAPWADWYGSPLTPKALAKLLTPYRVGPQQRRVRGEKSRGYFRSDFADAWTRYVPVDAEVSGTSGTSGTVPLAPVVPIEAAIPDSSESETRFGYEAPRPVPDVPDVPLVPDIQTPTATEIEAPAGLDVGDRPICLFSGCGRRTVPVQDRPGRYVCTGIHRPDVTA